MDPWEGRTGECTLEQLETDPDNFRPKTAPFDPRFPTTNQTRNCWINYVDYHKCLRVRQDDEDGQRVCSYFKRIYTSLCPSAWVEQWDELMAEKRFAWVEGERDRLREAKEGGH